MKLSIIIPAFEESGKISNDIFIADEYLRDEGISGEIIVVDDGSSDKTFDTALGTKSKISSSLRVIKNEVNCGKGCSIKKGVEAAEGEFILYTDAGSTVPLKFASLAIKMIEERPCEIVHGSRKLKESVIIIKQDADRRVISDLFLKFVKSFLKIPSSLTDTQCGFKIYKKEAAKKLYSELITERFVFEIELIKRAQNHEYRIEEIPIEWKCDRDSRISFLFTPWNVIAELLKIYFMRL